MHIARSLLSIRSFVGLVPLALLAAVAPACGGSAAPPPAEEVIDFGDVFAGNPTPQSITVQNDEKKAFRYKPLIVVANGGDVFTTTSNCGAPLLPSQSCDVKVVATGGALGPVTGDLYVFSDSGDVEAIDAALRVGAVDRVLGPKDKHYRLRAKVVPPHRLTSPSGSAALLRDSNLEPFRAIEVEVRNTGIAVTPERPGSTIAGELADRFEVTPCAQLLEPNASCKVTLRPKLGLDDPDIDGELDISGVKLKVETETARRWTVEAVPVPTDVDLVSVTANDEELWAVGTKGALFRSNDGSAWTAQPSAPVERPDLIVSHTHGAAMRQGPAKSVVVAGAEGVFLSADGGPFTALSTDPADGRWVHGKISAVESDSATSYRPHYTFATSTGTMLSGPWGSPLNRSKWTGGVSELRARSWVAGMEVSIGPDGMAVVITRKDNAPTFTVTEFGKGVQLRAMAEDLVVGDNGAAYKLAKEGFWTILNTGTTKVLRAAVQQPDVAAAAGDGVIALGTLGGLGAWRSFDAPNGAVLRSGARFKNEVFFVGDKGAIVRVRAVTR